MNNNVRYLISNSIDVTDRVLARKHIEEQSILIQKQKEQLERNLKEQEEFFLNMSHELKTPLNVILCTLQLLELYSNLDLTGENKNKNFRYRQVMKQNCYRLLRLINNFIDMSKIDAGYLKLNLQNLNIVSIVENISLSVADYIESKNISLVFDTDFEEKIIACDADKIERIILNLLSNAIKFTNPGGEIMVTITKHQDNICISVKDNGIGIPKDKIDAIFQRFNQVDKSLNRNHEGSGIGLAIVKSLVEMHNGIIEVKSTLGLGSTFTVSLPYRLVSNENDVPIEFTSSDDLERIHMEFSDI